MSHHREGQTLGGWTLVEFIDEGGNAEVWRGIAGNEQVALKILKRRSVESEPYKRFRQEIATLEQIGPQPGVMPLIASNLPDAPSRANPAWLAMPVGVPLDKSLSRQPLREVVAAVAYLANTLADLHATYGIHHRDLKPSNLYVLDGKPIISDFGLVDFPDADNLTLDGKPFGPKFFIPYEMISDPANADPGPADVFSLAKTLWVLCTGQRWPIPGAQQASNDDHKIGQYRPHSLSGELDTLLEWCTSHDPLLRPLMQQFAADLDSWLEIDSETPPRTADLSETWNRLRNVAESKISEVRSEEVQRLYFQMAIGEFQELMEPIHAEIRDNYPATEFNQWHKLVESLFFTVRPRHEITNEDIRATILSGPGWNPVQLFIGFAVRTIADGGLEFGGLFYLGRTKAAGGHIASWKSGLQSAPCGSIGVSAGLRKLAAEMKTMFPELLEQFVSAQES